MSISVSEVERGEGEGEVEWEERRKGGGGGEEWEGVRVECMGDVLMNSDLVPIPVMRCPLTPTTPCPIRS